MSKITFISTYPPIMCGIGNYLRDITAWLKPEDYQVLTFKKSKALKYIGEEELPNTKYIIPYNAPLKAINEINKVSKDSVIWIQHDFGIWHKQEEFIELVKKIKSKKIITLHTIHFQSDETAYGLKEKEYKFLEQILPLVDAITVFSDGVYYAIKGAFPQYENKIIEIRHGCKIYPSITRKLAKYSLTGFLLSSQHLSKNLKKQIEALSKIIYNKNVKLIGNFGFISFGKGIETIYLLRDELEKSLPKKRIISLYIGCVRNPKDPEHFECLKSLKKFHDGKKNFFINLYVPEVIFPALLKAFDAYIFWPREATQSGRLANLQGAEACVVGKNLEGIGETLKISGCPVMNSYAGLLHSLKQILSRPDYQRWVEKEAKNYAKKFKWKTQAKKHLILGNSLLKNKKRLPPLDQGYANYLYEARFKEVKTPKTDKEEL